MSDELDPRLLDLFAEANKEAPSAAFTVSVMQRVERDRRRTMAIWTVLAVFGIAVVASVAEPLMSAIGLTSQILPAQLIEIETDWLRQVASPINSVAAAAAIGIFGILKFWRRITG